MGTVFPVVALLRALSARQLPVNNLRISVPDLERLGIRISCGFDEAGSLNRAIQPPAAQLHRILQPAHVSFWIFNLLWRQGKVLLVRAKNRP